MDQFRHGVKTTEGWLSALASVFAVLVALKWVPINVSTAVQADAVKALPVIVVGYSIARSIAKVGWKRTLPLLESELGIPAAASTTTVTFPRGVPVGTFEPPTAVQPPVAPDDIPTAPAVTTDPAPVVSSEPSEPAPVAPTEPPADVPPLVEP